MKSTKTISLDLISSNLKILTAIVILLGLCSCEGNTTREFSVINNSSSPIFIKAKGFIAYDVDTLATVNEKITLFTYDLRGGNKNPGKITEYIDSLLIFNMLDTSSKNHTSNENWQIISDQVRKVPSNYYHSFSFEINDEDF